MSRKGDGIAARSRVKHAEHPASVGRRQHEHYDNVSLPRVTVAKPVQVAKAILNETVGADVIIPDGERVNNIFCPSVP